MSELPPGIEPARPPEPRASALGIVLRHGASGRWEVLLGQRSRRSNFLPGHLAFPGGRLEAADDPDRPGALRRCASRELAEETGLRIDPGSWGEAGARVTPPIFPVRFDTRMFVAELPAGSGLADSPPAPAEIETLGFFDPAEVVERWTASRALVPPPVLAVLRALSAGPLSGLGEIAGAVAETNGGEERAPRIEFVPGIWMLPVASLTLPPATHTNVWMPGGGAFAIVDPGSADPGEIDRLLEIVERRRRETGSRPAAVVLTHHHGDHVAGARRVAARLGLPIRAHADVLARFDPPVPGSRSVGEADVVDLDGLTLRALHTPGHAPGHLAFFIPERRALIAGDLVSGISTILIDPSEGDMGLYMNSLRRISRLECRSLLPGHGPPLPAQAAERLLAHRHDRERRVREAVASGPGTLADVARRAYSDVPAMPAVLTERQALSHLLDLERRDEVRRRDPGGKRWSIAAVPPPAGSAD